MKSLETFLEENFSEYRNANGLAEKLELAVRFILDEKGKTFEQIPWETQFLPVIIKHIFKIGHLKAVNPGMSHFSGMIEIPKSEINRHISQEFLPKTILCSPTEPVKTLLKKKSQEKIEYPVICKPNSGERSNGVQFITDDQELEAYTKESDKDFLLQEFCPYKCEFGIAVERKDKKTFSISSLAQKNTPSITGDGKKSVKELIQELSVTEEQKEKILRNASQKELSLIPKKGEEISIVRTASISLGTEILDIRDQITPALERQISKVLKNYKGFNVGRFDIKADSVQDIIDGKFTVIELNGINGIPMHVYDNKFSLEEKYEEIKAYFDRIYTYALKNQQEKNGKKSTLLSALRFFVRAVKNQPSSQALKDEWKENLRIIRKFFFYAEKTRIKQALQKNS